MPIQMQGQDVLVVKVWLMSGFRGKKNSAAWSE
jgi:hypothetical protein